MASLLSKREKTFLSKSRYMCGRQCSKRLWQTVYDPEPAEEPLPGTVMGMGIEVGVRARLLWPGGVLIDTRYDDYAEAIRRTKALIADPTVPAIFEAALVHDSVLMCGWPPPCKRSCCAWCRCRLQSCVNVPVGTVRSHLSRGRHILRKLLDMEDALPWRLWRRLSDVRHGGAGLVTYFSTRRHEPSGYLHERKKCQWAAID